MKVVPPLSGIWEDESLDTCLLVAITVLLMGKAKSDTGRGFGLPAPLPWGSPSIPDPPNFQTTIPPVAEETSKPPSLVLQTVPH